MTKKIHIGYDASSVVYGMAGVVDRLRPFGNGQVPSVAATAWRLLTAND